MNENKSELIMYETEDGTTKLDVRMQDDTVWLTQDQMAELFQRDKSTISKHIKKIFEEGELQPISVVAKYATTAADGKIYQVDHYSLDAIISVGYRVKSLRGTQFRIWANSILKEYITKGFAMNDDLLKQSGGGNYFDELLSRIRDIRSSEKVFWRKVLDIYATSIDYDPRAEASILFFQTVQNKLHFAVSGQTAAELISGRANAQLPFMGMTSFKGKKPTLADAKIAKNYLNETELQELNLIVSSYLDFAELQALRHKAMYMKDWIQRLNTFLQVSDYKILENAGSVSHADAMEKAQLEYEKYKKLHDKDLTAVEKAFLETIEKAEKKLLKE